VSDDGGLVAARLPARARLSEDATRLLRAAVVSGSYPDGHRMAVDELARQLGVSTMPVREALVALANEGLLEVLPRRGYRVENMSRQDIEDVFAVHSTVAGMLAARAAEVIDAETLETLRALQADVEAVAAERKPAIGREARIEQLNFDFHRTINRVPDARRLRWFLRTTTKFVPRRYYELIPAWVPATMDDHPLILDALERHDAEEARRLMIEHVEKAGALVLAQVDENGRFQPATGTRRSGR
jgi:DNA-binding GntR family transcriptional regulator